MYFVCIPFRHAFWTVSLLLSWPNTCSGFTNTDAGAKVHFRDVGSPEHHYEPAIATEALRDSLPQGG